MTEGDEHPMFHPSEYYPTWTVQPSTDELKQVLQHCTGWQCVPRPADQKAVAQFHKGGLIPLSKANSTYQNFL